jgi:hypothetical protein
MTTDLGLPKPEVFPQEGITTDEYFGGCPLCGGNDDVYHVGKGHWFVCHAHQTIWVGGINIFSIAKTQTEAEQRELWKQVEHYRDAQPVYPCDATPPASRATHVQDMTMNPTKAEIDLYANTTTFLVECDNNRQWKVSLLNVAADVYRPGGEYRCAALEAALNNGQLPFMDLDDVIPF